MENMPWIEIYKPQKLTDMYLNRTVEQFLLDSEKKCTIENSIFCGAPGIGKTASVLVLAKTVYGKNYNDSVLVVNGSDDRGIKVVQDTIITFCKKITRLGKAKHKLILLDEADNMTINTQQLINTLLEQYKANTRFVFTCNNSTKIIEAIQSRCHVFRFSSLSEKQIVDQLRLICKDRDIEFTEKSLKSVYSVSQGDMRNAINTLQLVYTTCKKLTEKNVFDTVNKPHPEEMKDLLLACYKGELKNALQRLEAMIKYGYCPSDIVLSMLNILRSYITTEIEEKDKMEFLKEISQTCMIISGGISTELQLVSCVCNLVREKVDK